MSDILIHAPYELLSCYLAATYLTEGAARLFVRIPDGNDDEFLCGTSTALQELSGAGERDAREKTASRVHILTGAAVDAGFEFSQVWYFSATPDPLRGFRTSSLEEPLLAALFRELDQVDFEQFNYVAQAFHGLESRAGMEEPNAPSEEAFAACVGEQCSARSKKCRIFRTPLVFGKISPLPRAGAARDLLHFANALHGFKAEIEQRCPDYFEYQSLRCRIPRDSCLGVLSARKAAESMVRMAREAGPLLDTIEISADQQVTGNDLCEWLGSTYGLSLLPEDPEEPLNVVDRIFDERLAGFYRAGFSGDVGCKAAIPALEACEEPRAMEQLFTAVRRIQEQEQSETKERVAGVHEKLERVAFTSKDAELAYFVTGSGPPLVLLNALGQGLHYWYPLIERLSREYRIVIWEPRGVTSQPYACGLDQQIEDLGAILRRENLHRCHLLAWCTGPKVAIEFCVRHPEAVASMTFLNSTFKCFDRPDAAETAYEHNLEALCRAVAKHPAMALSVMKSLKSEDDSQNIALSEMASDTLAASVVSRINCELQSHVLAPFRDEETTLNYVRQLMDFWSYDALEKAELVKVPVLLVSSEYDEIASPEASEEFANLLPSAWRVHIPGATHYCLYDRPDLVAQLIRSFCLSDRPVTPADVLQAAG